MRQNGRGGFLNALRSEQGGSGRGCSLRRAGLEAEASVGGHEEELEVAQVEAPVLQAELDDLRRCCDSDSDLLFVASSHVVLPLADSTRRRVRGHVERDRRRGGSWPHRRDRERLCEQARRFGHERLHEQRLVERAPEVKVLFGLMFTLLFQ